MCLGTEESAGAAGQCHNYLAYSALKKLFLHGWAPVGLEHWWDVSGGDSRAWAWGQLQQQGTAGEPRAVQGEFIVPGILQETPARSGPAAELPQCWGR